MGGPLRTLLSVGGGRSPRILRLVPLVYVLAVPYAKPADPLEIQRVMSEPRVGTYLAAAEGNLDRALELYAWNARVSAAFMLPAHFAEVATRNAVSEALTATYGQRWPWHQSFELSVPAAGKYYKQRRDLQDTRKRQPTTGKVIAELKFVFWQKMFTARHDERLWEPQILTLFPTAPQTGAAALRDRIYNDLEVIRKMRNRLSHHEPIINRDLARDLAKMLDLIELRSSSTAAWVRTMERASSLLRERP